jgi:uncharacterized protein YdhG (YjbR/CyaY superfamily)
MATKTRTTGQLDVDSGQWTDDEIAAMKEHAGELKRTKPGLASRTWYGMPAYTKNGKVVCFFKAASKFNGRYATFGFEEQAALDDGDMWATSYAIEKLTPAGEKVLANLVRKAAG